MATAARALTIRQRKQSSQQHKPLTKNGLISTLQATQRDQSKFLQSALADLRPYLPRGFSQSSQWEVIRCGKNIGIRIKCHLCGAKPPKGNQDNGWHRGDRRWRWMAMHEAMHRRAIKHFVKDGGV